MVTLLLLPFSSLLDNNSKIKKNQIGNSLLSTKKYFSGGKTWYCAVQIECFNESFLFYVGFIVIESIDFMGVSKLLFQLLHYQQKKH